MDHGEIRSLCLVAKNLAADVNDDDLRPFAFSAIFTTLLSTHQQSVMGGNSAPPVRAEVRSTLSGQNSSKGVRKAGLKSRLLDLVSQRFFHEPRTLADIASELKIAGWIHEPKEISARLIEIVRAKKLRRSETSSGLKYSNW